MSLRKGLYYITIHENVFRYFKVMTAELLPLITKLIAWTRLSDFTFTKLIFKKKIIFPLYGDDHNLMFIFIFMFCHCVLAAQLCPTLCNPMDCSPPGSSIHGIFQTRVLEWIAISFSRDLPNLGIESRSPAPWADSLLSGPPGKPMNTGVGSLSLLQGIVPTQELNRGLLRCRQILYQLSHQGSPRVSELWPI